MTALKYSTKAQTLISLQGRLHTAVIPLSVCFSVLEWRKERNAVIAAIQNDFPDSMALIVRSSCHREDSSQHSNAGAFLSLPNVFFDELETAIEKVIASYGDAQERDEVLVQPMLAQVIKSGVAFSHDPNTCAPYRIINWTEGNDTAAVTGGAGGRTWQQAANSPLAPPSELRAVVRLLEELLGLFAGAPVDCEFAVTSDAQGEERLWLLQARPLVLPGKPRSDSTQASHLKCVEEKVARGMRPHPFLMGRRNVYGVMPDWNPAEILGVRPKPLALSLYRELVTDSIWAYQRHNYGYRNLRSFPLMLHFYGLPYIDVRVSFNSFIPADLEEGLSGRLVDHYIDHLLLEPTLHDKVEFEIVFSCYTLDFPQRIQRLTDAGFSNTEQTKIADSLRRLTNRIVHPHDGLWRADAAKLGTLKTRREALFNSSTDPIERIYWLLEDTKRYGTLPFAGLARAGFVAVQMLKSLVSVNVLSEDDYDCFMRNLSTVSSQLARDRAVLDKVTFLERYGHLRPGTYDIMLPRYDEAPELYFDWDQRPAPPEPAKPFALTLPQMRSIARLLDAHGLQPDPVGLFDFLQAGIELRELAKFHFTHNLSNILALIVSYGEQLGIPREELAYCDISAFKELHVAAVDSKNVLTGSIAQGKDRYDDSLAISLPPIITRPEDVWSFEWPRVTPNFVTQKQVTAPVIRCESGATIAGAIVCIPNADPGFDWLFAYPIAGLITAWGGANSHMAIRAGELGLPAVIGAGEVLYQRWSSAQRLHLDCAGRRVEVLA